MTRDLSAGNKCGDPSLDNSSPEFLDPLLESLLAIARIERITCSSSALISGLPLVKGKLTPKLYVRAAARAGLEASILARSLSSISSLVLPAVLLLEENRCVVLVAIDQAKQLAKVIEPGVSGQVQVPISELMAGYSGYVIYTRPKVQYDQRVTTPKADLNRHWFWDVLAQSWRIYRDVLIASLLINIFALANPLFVMNVYDRVVPNDAIETLWVLAIGIIVLYGFDFLLKTLRVFFIEVAGKKSDILLSALILERVLGAQYAAHPPSVGAFASQLREFETVRNFITSSTITAFIDLPFTLLFILTIAYLGGVLVWVPLAAIPIILMYAWLVQSRLSQTIAHTFTASAQKNATLVESLNGLETIKILGTEGYIQRRWEQAVGALSQWGLKTRMISTSATSFAGLMQQLTGVFIVILGVYAIADQSLTMGALIACVILSSRAVGPIAQVAGLTAQYHQARLALSSLENIVLTEQERPEQRVFVKRPRLEGAIEFNQVTFTYPGESNASLTNVSFKIAAGERVALIGRLGSGKTTVQKLLLSLYKPASGSILLDHIDIQQLDPADLRRNIGCVPQDVTLFYGSVKDNIAFGHPEVSDERILTIAELAGVTEFVNRHPMGFERLVGERGEALSGGQRQAIAVARALLHKPPILLLDEPTTAMDHTSEARLLKQLIQYCRTKTVLLVTHKTALLPLVDRVIVLDQGKLIADGPKDAVLEALKKGQLHVS